MRFVSKFPKLGLGTFQKEKFVLALDGQRDQTAESISVTFSQENLGAADVKFALAFWPEKEFTGRWLDEDEITLQPVGERIGVFDTNDCGWDNGLRERVEKWMLAKPNYGLDFTSITEVPAKAPWATYDTMHWQKIAPYAVEGGLVAEALEYERATKNRPSIVEALESAEPIPAESADGELIAA